jgi:hypothetical protein
MNNKQHTLITLEDLGTIGFNSDSYINNSIDGIDADFVTHINTVLQHHYRDKNLTSVSNKKLPNAVDALLELITSNEYEANIIKSNAMQNINDSDVNIDNIVSYFEALAPAPVNTHSKKLMLINKALREHNQGLFGGGSQMSIESIFHQLETLQKVIENLSDSDTEFKKLEDKNIKTKLDMEFIKSLYVEWKIFTGATNSLYTTNPIDDSISGEFFNLVKLCFTKEGRSLTDGSIKHKISEARLK